MPTSPWACLVTSFTFPYDAGRRGQVTVAQMPRVLLRAMLHIAPLSARVNTIWCSNVTTGGTDGTPSRHVPLPQRHDLGGRGAIHDVPHLVRQSAQRVVMQVRISGRGLGLCVSEKGADHGKAGARAGEN